eukprot:980226-Ditylum_brightwellii.AAC.1
MIIDAIPPEMLVSKPKITTVRNSSTDKKTPHMLKLSSVTADDLEEALEGSASDQPMEADDLVGFQGKIYIVWVAKTRYQLQHLIGVYNSLLVAQNVFNGLKGSMWQGHDSPEELFVNHLLLLHIMAHKYYSILKHTPPAKKVDSDCKHKGNQCVPHQGYTFPNKRGNSKLNWSMLPNGDESSTSVGDETYEDDLSLQLSGADEGNQSAGWESRILPHYHNKDHNKIRHLVASGTKEHMIHQCCEVFGVTCKSTGYHL